MATVLTTAGALLAFQALAVIGAVPAAAASCTQNPANGAIQITLASGDDIAVAMETAAADLDPQSNPGLLLVDADPTAGVDYDNGPASQACGSQPPTSVTVLGTPSGNEVFTIDENSGGVFGSSVTWAIDLGGSTADLFSILGNDDVDNEVVVTNNSFTLNGVGGPLLGVEDVTLVGGAGDDTLDASGFTAGDSTLTGGDGDDVLMPSVTTAGDDITGGAGTDTVSYEGATASQCIVIDNPVVAGTGLDANCDGDVADAGDQVDNLIDFLEVLQSGAGNDTLIGAAGIDETFVPGDGDDDITGNGGDDDVIDWSSSSAAMTIDPANGTATGQGTDTFTDVFRYVGSDFDDMLLWDGTTTFFSGGDGTDTVDASADTAGVTINLDTLDGTPDSAPDDLEVAIGGSGSDTLVGNDIRNTLQGGEGDDDLAGDEGNDTLMGGPGNDDYTGGAGADRVSFAESAAGVNVDLSLGFASGEGDDEFGDLVEVIVGSSHDDTITGGPFAFGGTVNFLFSGGAGDDVLTGFAGNDSLRGGGGRDVLRGVNGDDTLLAGSGNDRLFGGSGVDVGRGGPGKDVCRGVEVKSSCGSKRHPKAPVTRQRL